MARNFPYNVVESSVSELKLVLYLSLIHILNLELIRNGYPAINIKYADRKRYYDAFDAFYRDGKAKDMVLLVAESANEQLDLSLIHI